MICIAKILRYRRLIVVLAGAFLLLQLILVSKSLKKSEISPPPDPVIDGIPLGVWMQRTSTSPPTKHPIDIGPNIIFDQGIPKDRIHHRIYRKKLPEERIEDRDKDLPLLEDLNVSDLQSRQMPMGLNLSICRDFKHQNSPYPILTLFTTFSLHSNQTWIIQNMLKNRALLSPQVRSIYYYVGKERGVEIFQRLAISCGLHVYPAPKIHEDSRLPILKDMWMHAERVSKTDYYAYANADILFTQDLSQTVTFLQTKSAYLDKVNYLVIGQRTGYKFEAPTTIQTLEDVMEFAARGERAEVDAQDYFITAKGHYPWKDIPDFVVGNVLYDNWIVTHAFTNQMAVFDVTYSITALHLSDGSTSNHHHDDSINVLMAGNTSQLVLGMTKCAHFETGWPPDIDRRNGGQPYLSRKRGKHSPCWYNFQKFGIDKDIFQTLIPYT